MNPFQKILSETLSVSNGLDSDQSLLIWVQIVCKGYHQATNIIASMERINVDYIEKRKKQKVAKSFYRQNHVSSLTFVEYGSCARSMFSDASFDVTLGITDLFMDLKPM